MKYKVASYINIYSNNNLYYLESKFKEGKEYIINESIFNFISLFYEYKTFDEVLNYYNDLIINDDNNKLRIILLSFFNDLINEKVLIHEDEIEPKLKIKFSLKENEFLNKYRIIKPIASSKNIEIYKVYFDNEFFILKGYFKEKFTYEVNFKLFSENLIKEYNILNIFNHKNINKTEECIISNDYTFIILSYVNGQNIYDFISKNKFNFSLKEEIINQIINAFSIIHSKNVIHGDIHFGNILMDIKTPIIIDFGLSNYENDLKYNNGGLPEFMPPERISADFKNKYINPSSFQSDVYQLGILIYFILMEKFPFKSSNWKDLVFEKQNFVLRKNNKLNKFYDLICKCLEINLENRFIKISDIKL